MSPTTKNEPSCERCQCQRQVHPTNLRPAPRRSLDVPFPMPGKELGEDLTYFQLRMPHSTHIPGQRKTAFPGNKWPRIANHGDLAGSNQATQPPLRSTNQQPSGDLHQQGRMLVDPVEIRYLLKHEAIEWYHREYWMNVVTWDTVRKALLSRFPDPIEEEEGSDWAV